ncbi:hypothetical protein GCM10025875_10750 [Litorihabitans aurantiacus]|uniref:Polymerase/histidinol phosphatase N-terminal domain-containing protein n=1 Tax=Litorihabitans aurantiacus TaxID=1930061 RepID=A0AA37UHU3_9MICO|nr:hypothetical protein GCM10025875_10750 [Litorihabitans aurantiacus]
MTSAGSRGSTSTVVPYAELHTHSAFSFLDGANQPEELVAEAVRLGLSGLGLTDHDGLHGVVRFARAAAAVNLPTVIGAELGLAAATERTGVPDPDSTHLVVLARDPEGYARLSRAIATAHLVTGRKGVRDYGRAVGLDPLEVLAEQAGARRAATGSCSPGAARGRCGVRSTPTAPGGCGTPARRAGSWTGWWRSSDATTSPSS